MASCSYFVGRTDISVAHSHVFLVPWSWVDTLGHGSLFDYDPLWARCTELGVAPSFHGVGYGWGSRVSATNYVHNHLGNFGAA